MSPQPIDLRRFPKIIKAILPLIRYIGLRTVVLGDLVSYVNDVTNINEFKIKIHLTIGGYTNNYVMIAFFGKT